jgi:hypothetical protein
MMVFKKAIPRRAFLRGAGAALALPLLDSMVPAFAAPAAPALRLGFVYCPNGMIVDQWRPGAEGPSYLATPILQPLASFRENFVVLGGLDLNVAYSRPGDGDNAPHERAGGAFLTGVHPTREGQLGISVDQIAAQELGKATQLASLELCLHDTDVVGQCEKGWNCAYMQTLSWRSATTPLPCENHPRAVFENLFGDSDSTEAAERSARNRKYRSLLDSVTEAATRLMRDVGSTDRNKLAEYLDAVRDVERRIQRAEDQSSRNVPTLTRPGGIPATFDEHAKLMFDLQVLAFQTDLTRVSTFMMGREQSDRTFREIGIADSHHGLTHHSNDPVKIAKVLQINILHARLFAYFLDKLRSTPDGDGSLLDHSMIVYGSGISEGNSHSYTDLPILLAGGTAVNIKGGRHLRHPKDTPITNLYITLLDKLGVAVDKIGDSNGKLDFPAMV